MTQETVSGRCVWREPAEVERHRAKLQGRLAGSALTHWLNLDRIVASGFGVTRAAKATTDCGIAVTGRINDPHADNGLVMPPDTPVTCEGCLHAQGGGYVDAVTQHLALTRAVAGMSGRAA